MYVIYIVTRDKENLVTTFSIVGLFKDENKAKEFYNKKIDYYTTNFKNMNGFKTDVLINFVNSDF